LKKINTRTKIKIYFLLTKQNIHSYKEFINYVKEKNLFCVIQPLRKPFNRKQEKDWHKKVPLWIEDPIIIKEAISYFKEMKKREVKIVNPFPNLDLIEKYMLKQSEFLNIKPTCFLPYTNYSINPDGRVNLCHSDNFIGKMPEEKPEVIWKSYLAENDRKKLKKCPKTCRIVDKYS
jgi:sulfatase maturation enzyme AslB (radical SAM superfamily)